MWEISRSMVHQSGPLRGRWNPCTIGYKTTPQWPEMVQATSRYDPGKLTLLLQNFDPFCLFWGHFWAGFSTDMWEISRSILNRSGPLRGRWNPCTIRYKTTPQWPEMVNATSRYDPGRLTLLLRNFDSFCPFGGHFWAGFSTDMWGISRSILHRSGPLRGRWNPCTVGYKTTPQWPEMVQATSRYVPGKLTLLLQISTHLPILGSFLGRIFNGYVGDFSKHTAPIRATKVSLESLHHRLQNDTTIAGNGSGHFEICPWEVDLASSKF